MAHDALNNRKLPLPIGVSHFPQVADTCYLVDKTLMIRDLIDDGAVSLLFTRPRRFGKTLNMSMLKTFFEIPEPGNDTARFFRTRNIWQCGERYTRHQGAHPVIFLSLKSARYDTWEDTYEALRRLVCAEAQRIRHLVDEAACANWELDVLHSLWDGNPSPIDLGQSLKAFSSALHASTGNRTVILVDEYDVPIAQAHRCGFYRQCIDFMRIFLGEGFKDNEYLYKGVMTGVLRVAQEGLFSGFNNPQVYTVLDDAYAQYFGLEPDEVNELLSYYGRSDAYPEVCAWYDGYRFGTADIFNPWSVLKYVASGCKPAAYWVNTAENSTLSEIVAHSSPSTLDDIHRLMDGESFITPIEVGTVYPHIGEDPTSIWSFLLMAGYLKAQPEALVGTVQWYRVKLPNTEIRQVYGTEILSAFSSALPVKSVNPVQRALIEGDARRVQESFADLLRLASVRDTWGESFYQGFTLGLLALLDDFGYRVLSNREAGEGYFDVALEPTQPGKPGIVIELKAATKRTDAEHLEKLATAALNQIAAHGYAADMRAGGIDPIFCYGVAFCGKDVAVAMG